MSMQKKKKTARRGRATQKKKAGLSLAESKQAVQQRIDPHRPSIVAKGPAGINYQFMGINTLSNLGIPGNTLKITDISTSRTKMQRLTGTYTVGILNYLTGDGVTELFQGYANSIQANCLLIHPEWMFVKPSRQYDLMSHYMRWKFRKLRIHYVPRAASTATPIFGMCYISDGAIAWNTYINSNYTYTDSLDTEPSLQQSVWRPVTLDCSQYLRQDTWFYFDQDLTVSDPASRQQFQGAIVFNSDSTSGFTSGITYGTFVLEYEIDISDPAPYQDQVLRNGLSVPKRPSEYHGVKPLSKVESKGEVDDEVRHAPSVPSPALPPPREVSVSEPLLVRPLQRSESGSLGGLGPAQATSNMLRQRR